LKVIKKKWCNFEMGSGDRHESDSGIEGTDNYENYINPYVDSSKLSGGEKGYSAGGSGAVGAGGQKRLRLMRAGVDLGVTGLGCGVGLKVIKKKWCNFKMR
jgi:hypothetical protein